MRPGVPGRRDSLSGGPWTAARSVRAPGPSPSRSQRRGRRGPRPPRWRGRSATSATTSCHALAARGLTRERPGQLGGRRVRRHDRAVGASPATGTVTSSAPATSVCGDATTRSPRAAIDRNRTPAGTPALASPSTSVRSLAELLDHGRHRGRARGRGRWRRRRGRGPPVVRRPSPPRPWPGRRPRGASRSWPRGRAGRGRSPAPRARRSASRVTSPPSEWAYTSTWRRGSAAATCSTRSARRAAGATASPWVSPDV